MGTRNQLDHLCYSYLKPFAAESNAFSKEDAKVHPGRMESSVREAWPEVPSPQPRRVAKEEGCLCRVSIVFVELQVHEELGNSILLVGGRRFGRGFCDIGGSG